MTPLAFIDGLGGPEVMLVLALVLVLFGGKKLPEFARGMGKALREFQRAKAGVQEEFKRALEPEPPPNLPPLAAPNLDATPADLSPTLPPPRPTPSDVRKAPR